MKEGWDSLDTCSESCLALGPYFTKLLPPLMTIFWYLLTPEKVKQCLPYNVQNKPETCQYFVLASALPGPESDAQVHASPE